MASKENMDYAYSTIDKIFRLSMGEMGDFSGAKYDGDFLVSLEEAQRAKHEYIVRQLKIDKNTKVIDLGCGWGPFLNYATKHIGAKGLGLTLSEGQKEACLKNGLEVYLKDCRSIKSADFGTFDAAVSIGAFEHFSSVEDYQAGRQEQVYKDFFGSVHAILPTGARFFLQTMTFGKNAIPYETISADADRDSNEYIMALMVKQFPGSWLPASADMVIDCARPMFKLVEISNGREDYIETISQWRKRFRKFNIKKYALYLSLLPRYLWDKDFRYRVEVFKINPNKICFEREIMDHYRMVFERI